MKTDAPVAARSEPGVAQSRRLRRLQEARRQPGRSVGVPKGADLAPITAPPEVGPRSPGPAVEAYRGAGKEAQQPSVPEMACGDVGSIKGNFGPRSRWHW